MRLNNHKGTREKTAPVDGEGTTTSASTGSEAKPSRSSLDFKVKRRSHDVLTTKPGKRKIRQQQQTNPNKEEQQMLLQRSHPTRARGSSGPPPRKYDLSDLEHMDENQLLQALYEDPELAAAAARVAEEFNADESRTSTGPRSSRSSTSDRITNSKHPEHLREIMDGGVPVMQWVIILVLMGLGLYQLRKTLALPDKKAPKGPTKTNRSLGGGKGKQKKLKKPTGVVERPKQRAPEPPMVKPARQKPVEEVAKLIDPAESNKPTPAKKAPPAKKQASKKKKQKSAAKDKQQHTDILASDSSHGADNDGGEADKSTPVDPVNTPIQTETEDDGEGWQTVTKTKAAAAPKPVEAKSSEKENPVHEEAKGANGSAAKAPAATDSTEKENEPKPVNGESKPANGSTNGAQAPKNSRKNKKKQKAKNTPVAASGQANTTAAVDDATLAAQLQQEEERFATKEGAGAEDDSWEPVTTRKRKGVKA